MEKLGNSSSTRVICCHADRFRGSGPASFCHNAATRVRSRTLKLTTWLNLPQTYAAYLQHTTSDIHQPLDKKQGRRHVKERGSVGYVSCITPATCPPLTRLCFSSLLLSQCLYNAYGVRADDLLELSILGDMSNDMSDHPPVPLVTLPTGSRGDLTMGVA